MNRDNYYTSDSSRPNKQSRYLKTMLHNSANTLLIDLFDPSTSLREALVATSSYHCGSRTNDGAFKAQHRSHEEIQSGQFPIHVAPFLDLDQRFCMNGSREVSLTHSYTSTQGISANSSHTRNATLMHNRSHSSQNTQTPQLPDPPRSNPQTPLTLR